MLQHGQCAHTCGHCGLAVCAVLKVASSSHTLNPALVFHSQNTCPPHSLDQPHLFLPCLHLVSSLLFRFWQSHWIHTLVPHAGTPCAPFPGPASHLPQSRKFLFRTISLPLDPCSCPPGTPCAPFPGSASPPPSLPPSSCE